MNNSAISINKIDNMLTMWSGAKAGSYDKNLVGPFSVSNNKNLVGPFSGSNDKNGVASFSGPFKTLLFWD